MAIIRYNVTARLGGTPTAGLSPVWNTLVQSVGATVVATPNTTVPITSLTGGGYQVAYDPTGTLGELYGILDFGASLTDPNERYADITLALDPSYALTNNTVAQKFVFSGANVNSAVITLPTTVLQTADHSAIQSDVTSGLTTQGYTATRSGYLDTLNALGATVWSALTANLTTAGSIGKLLSVFTFNGSNVNSSPQTNVNLNLTQAIPTSNTAQTVGDALNAARAEGFGRWVLSGTALTLYAGDGTTVVRTFTLDSATSPTQRS